MRLASYNVENLFDRAKVMNLGDWDEGRPILSAFSEANALLGKLDYSGPDKARIAQLLIGLGLEKSDRGPFVVLRRNRKGLLKRSRDGGLVVTASGRADWAGSLELLEEPIRHEAMLNTARIIADVGADVLGVIEAEDRPSLAEFNRAILSAVGGSPYAHVMVIDGNDSRGIDVGILCRAGYRIDSMCSHVDDMGEDGRPIFSRDCAQYRLVTKAGNRLIVMVNHFKSKGYGAPAESNRRRRAQADRVRQIYEALRQAGEEAIAILGDLNDTPGSDPMEPLVGQTDLRDAWTHPEFDDGGYPGTFGGCGPSSKIDYIFLSPALFARVRRGGVNRRGMWPGVRPRKWDVIETLRRPEDSASDHAALWVDLDI